MYQLVGAVARSSSIPPARRPKPRNPIPMPIAETGAQITGGAF